MQTKFPPKHAAIINTMNIYNQSYLTVKYKAQEDIISINDIIIIKILNPNASNNIPHMKRHEPFTTPNNIPKINIDD